MRSSFLNGSRISSFLLFVAGIFLLSGPWLAASIPEYSDQTWQVSDGLPSSQVRAILQTRNRFLWLGTQEGLARFDGTTFTVVDRRRFWDMRAHQFIGLEEASDGAVWFSNGHGLTRFKDDALAFFGRTNGLQSDYVTVLLNDSRGTLWIGTDRGLAKFVNGKFAVASEIVSTNTGVRALIEDHAHALWVGTGTGLIRYQDGKSTTYLRGPNNLLDNSILSLAEGSNGRIWVGTSSGLNCIDGEKILRFGKKFGLLSSNVRALCRDKSGTLWVGTSEGLQRLVNEQLPFVTTAPLRGDTGDTIAEPVLSIFQDDEENIWVGSTLGLRRLKQERFKTFSVKEGLPHKVVTSVIEDHNGVMWLTTAAGVARIVGSTVTNFSLPDGTLPLAKKQLLSLMEDQRGDMWVGSFDGLFRVTNDTVLHYKAPRTRLADNTTRAMLHMTNGTYWFGNNSGLTRYRFLLFTNFAAQIGVSFNNVRALVEGKDGRVWVGSEEGLTMIKGDTWRRLTMRSGLSSEFVNALYVDKEDTLWIGTESGGLNRLKNQKLAAITPASGMFSERIYGILEDDAGNFWMSSRQGIFRVAKKELDAFADGKINAVHCVSYGRADGIRNIQCTAWGQPAAWKSRDGRLWFATVDGVVVTDPKNIKVNPVPPRVVLTDMRVDGQAVVPTDNSRFPAGKGNFEFYFTAISLQSPEKVRFRYKLEGLDKDWIDAGGRRSASYSNLRAGDYRFLVSACNNDEVWAQHPMEISFTAASHVYETTTFYLAGTIVVLIVGFSVHRVRLRTLQDRQKELASLVEQRTEHLQNTLKSMEIFTYSMAHDLRSPLRAVKGLTRALQEDYGEHFDAVGRDYSTRIEGAVDKMDCLIQDMLVYGTLTHAQVELVPLSLHAVIDEVLMELKSQIAAKNASIEVTPPLPEINGCRTILHQVLSNLISNALKFVPPEITPHLKIWAVEKEGKVKIYVRDNGIGIKPEHHEKIFQLFQRLHGNADYPGTGVGLAVVRKGTERLGGAVGLESSPGKGSCFWIELSKAVK